MKLSKRKKCVWKAVRPDKAHTTSSTPAVLLLLLLLGIFSLLHCYAFPLGLRASGIDSHTTLTETRDGGCSPFLSFGTKRVNSTNCATLTTSPETPDPPFRAV